MASLRSSASVGGCPSRILAICILQRARKASQRLLAVVHTGAFGFPESGLHRRVIDLAQAGIEGGIDIFQAPQVDAVGELMDQETLSSNMLKIG